MTIEVDPIAAEILHRAQTRAQSRGESLGAYLQQALPNNSAPEKTIAEQMAAWKEFVAGMTALTENLPKGHFVDDSREAMYDDRN